MVPSVEEAKTGLLENTKNAAKKSAKHTMKIKFLFAVFFLIQPINNYTIKATLSYSVNICRSFWSQFYLFDLFLKEDLEIAKGNLIS